MKLRTGRFVVVSGLAVAAMVLFAFAGAPKNTVVSHLRGLRPQSALGPNAQPKTSTTCVTPGCIASDISLTVTDDGSGGLIFTGLVTSGDTDCLGGRPVTISGDTLGDLFGAPADITAPDGSYFADLPVDPGDAPYVAHIQEQPSGTYAGSPPKICSGADSAPASP